MSEIKWRDAGAAHLLTSIERQYKCAIPGLLKVKKTFGNVDVGFNKFRIWYEVGSKRFKSFEDAVRALKESE